MGRRKKSVPSANTGFSLADLKRLFDEKAAEVEALQARRAEIQSTLDTIDSAIAASMGDGRALRLGVKRGPGRPRKVVSAVGAPSAAAVPAKRGGRKGKRGPRGEGGLQNMIRTVLAGSSEPVKLADVAAKVIEAGYQTGSSKFAVIVGQRLSEMSDVKKAGRGLYQLKK